MFCCTLVIVGFVLSILFNVTSFIAMFPTLSVTYTFMVLLSYTSPTMLYILLNSLLIFGIVIISFLSNPIFTISKASVAFTVNAFVLAHVLLSIFTDVVTTGLLLSKYDICIGINEEPYPTESTACI